MRLSKALILVLVPLLFACGGNVTGYTIPNPPVPGPDTPVTPTDPDTPPAPDLHDHIIVGYATYWDSTIPDPTLLTHINYAFAHIKDDFETLDIKTPSRLARIAALKTTNPNLKILLSVGGWEAGNFSEMAADATHRKNFANNCLAAVQQYSLDGIDIDWEYPGSSDAGISSSPNDKANFTLLMKDLRETLGENRLLTIAGSANPKYIDFTNAVQYMDFVNLMTYDMGKPPKHNAALYPSTSGMTKADHSCSESVALHIAAGVPRDKIVLGIPFYGYSSSSSKTIDFNEINFTGLYKRWDDECKVPYLIDASGTMVFTYDDENSVGLKATYVKEQGLKGAMYWNIEADDASWTLSKAIAARLIDWTPAEVPQDAFLATNQYVEKYLEEVDYPNNNNPDTDQEYNNTLIATSAGTGLFPGGGPSTNNQEIPPTYTIKWTAPTSGKQKLVLSERNWRREYSLAAGVNEQPVTNLVPGTTYHWMVTSVSNSSIIAEGSFATRGMLHQVYFTPNVRNGRDLGGWKGLGGKTIVYHKLYRGGAIHDDRTNDDGKKEMLAEGIRAEVDLREADDVPSSSPLGSSVAFFAPGFDSGYNHMVRDNPDKVKETFMWVVARLREGKPVYFHCSAGRDRTGTLAVLLLGPLGVSESDMAKDYELTYFSPADWSMYTNDSNGYGYWHTRNNYSYKSIRKTIYDMTDSGTYQERIVKYLLKIGVPQEDIDDLRSIMLGGN